MTRRLSGDLQSSLSKAGGFTPAKCLSSALLERAGYVFADLSVNEFSKKGFGI
jgi:hypothetical protein